MKRTALALTLILTLLASIMDGMPFVNVARANFVPAAEISITVPTNKTYNSDLLVLNYTVYFTLTKNKLIVYSIDGGSNVTILSNQSSQFYEIICEQVILPKLSDGSHRLEVYGVYAEDEGAPGFAQVYFTIDTTPLTISNLSVENKTYYSTDISLNFTVGEPAGWIGYSLDQQINSTITGNTTLTGLAEGPHNLRLYANDTNGNMGSSQTVYFTVGQKTDNEAEQQTEVFPMLSIAIIASVLAAVCLSLIVCFKKRKR